MQYAERLAWIVGAALLVGPATSMAQEGYKPVESLVALEKEGGPPKEDLDEPVARVHARGFFRGTYLSGSNEIGHDESEKFEEAPSFNRAFQPGFGGGFDLVYTLVPVFSLQYNVTFQYYGGREVTSGLNPGDELKFKDLWVFETSVGPRINFPLELPASRWSDKHSVQYVRGLVPYLRLGLGYALSGEVDSTFNGQEDTYYASTGSFHTIFALGTEFHAERWGIFIEMFAVERFGPLDKADESARSSAVVGFPFSFGVICKF